MVRLNNQQQPPSNPTVHDAASADQPSVDLAQSDLAAYDIRSLENQKHNIKALGHRQYVRCPKAFSRLGFSVN